MKKSILFICAALALTACNKGGTGGTSDEDNTRFGTGSSISTSNSMTNGTESQGGANTPGGLNSGTGSSSASTNGTGTGTTGSSTDNQDSSRPVR
jgi:hypothetical protein